MIITIEEEDKVYRFNLPRWAEERRLVLLAGIELVFEKVPQNDVELKTVRCDCCGQCCMDFTPNSNPTPYGADNEGKCKALIKEGDKWICSAGYNKPYRCLHDPLKVNTPECAIVREIIHGNYKAK